MSANSGSRLRVEVSVVRWQDGPYGRWARVDVHECTETSQATLSAKRVGAEPPQGQRFSCDIEMSSGGRWSVVALGTDHLPSRIDPFDVVVHQQPYTPDRKSYALQACDPSLTGAMPLRLAVRMAQNHGIAMLCPGAVLGVSASLSAGAYQVDSVHMPLTGITVYDSPDGAPEMDKHFLAYAMEDWNPERGVKAVRFALRTTDPLVYALLWIKVEILRTAGISLVRGMALPEAEDEVTGLAIAERASTVLRTGTREQIDALVIDRLVVVIRPARAGKSVNLHRIVHPQALREPITGEVVEWVEGTVTSNDQTICSKHGESLKKVFISIDDQRIGRGICTALRSSAQVESQELIPGAKLVIRLRGTEQYWKVEYIHRVTPPQRAADDDSQVVQ